MGAVGATLGPDNASETHARRLLSKAHCAGVITRVCMRAPEVDRCVVLGGGDERVGNGAKGVGGIHYINASERPPDLIRPTDRPNTDRPRTTENQPHATANAAQAFRSFSSAFSTQPYRAAASHYCPLSVRGFCLVFLLFLCVYV